MTMMPNVIQFQPKPTIPALRRPRLLAQAARAGLASYVRDRDLRRILRSDDLPEGGKVLMQLRAEEAELEAARQEKRADYDLSRHILLLIAVLAEVRNSGPVAVTYPEKASLARP